MFSFFFGLCALNADRVPSRESRYLVVGIGLFLVSGILASQRPTWVKISRCQLCALYYYVWIILLPKVGGYNIVEEVVELDGGALTSRLVRKYKTQSLEERPLLASPESESE